MEICWTLLNGTLPIPATFSVSPVDPAPMLTLSTVPFTSVLAAVLPDVLLNERFEELPARGVECALLAQDGAERPGLVIEPGLHGGEQSVARDKRVLVGKNAQQQIAIGVGLRHGGTRTRGMG